MGQEINTPLNIDMRISILSKNHDGTWKPVGIIIAVLIGVIPVVLLINYIQIFIVSSLGNGLFYNHQGRSDNSYIEKNGVAIIEPAIIDLSENNQYVFGLRLPAEHLECNGGYLIKVSPNKQYFILNKNTEESKFFKSKELFVNELKNMGVQEEVSLDYDKLEKWSSEYKDRNSKRKFKDCKHLDYDW